MPRLIDLPQLLADTDAQAQRYEVLALNAVGPTRWDERQRWLDRAHELRTLAARLTRLKARGEAHGQAAEAA